MHIPIKKLKNGFEMPGFGMGTYKMGEENRDQDDINTIKAAIDLGITHIDTAEAYADGSAEEIVGKAIKGRVRSGLFIVSKVQESHLNYQETKTALHRV